MSRPSGAVDRRAARRNFERAAATYAGASRLEAEVAGRMLERLDYVRIAPRRILDAGSGPARDAAALLTRYPGASLVALDFSLAMLRARRRRWFERTAPLRLCADMERVPLADGTADLVWSNLALHWAADPAAALREFARVLAPGGLIMFSTLGPDTLKELRAAAGAGRVHAFPDMHDIGDLLVATGLSAPVMDMEMITLAYSGRPGLLDDLRASGQTSARSDRPRGLTGKRAGAALRADFPQASFEVVYGHAWKGAPRSETGTKTVRVYKRVP